MGLLYPYFYLYMLRKNCLIKFFIEGKIKKKDGTKVKTRKKK